MLSAFFPVVCLFLFFELLLEVEVDVIFVIEMVFASFSSPCFGLRRSLALRLFSQRLSLALGTMGSRSLTLPIVDNG